ncbi:toxin secretion/phage lysis holin [Alkaliphilus metalliredigens QYMF]|uniref:Toxin secretion/phage lysis holin n=1 Tax=Alkaliphilus metalliredigens (strain QYMF) TaxID=293826 RepID=A6TQX3_ALKMQ|nr:phage holin family protein [Alkaliphilus metalliredigens]ABR48591.1 toxin secretion/phage lysis holin [Alkaliphilus metalliredigens QYMF]
MSINNIGNIIKATLATIGGTLSYILGGWDTALLTLMIMMAVDFISGWTVAAVFKSSPKTEKGALESKAGLKGLLRKGQVLLIVLVATRLDILIGTGELVRNTAIVGFCLNELVSIVENTGLMGVPLPPIITHAIDILEKKNDEVKIR